MSYSIMYDQQFIEVAGAIVPVICSGDNNVYETNRRRARDWHVLGRKAIYSAQELTDLAESWCGGEYQEHWVSNGKWVDDAALRRWMKNSIKNAASVEEILEANPCVSIYCKLSVWEDSHEIVNSDTVRTSEELEQWVATAIAKENEIKTRNNKSSVYFLVGFSVYGNNKLRHPKTLRNSVPTCKEVVLKRGKCFITEITRSKEGKINGFSSESTPTNALVFDRSNGIEVANEISAWGRPVRVCRKHYKDAPYDAIIVVDAGKDSYRKYEGMYVTKYRGGHISFSPYESSAKHFSDKKAAQKAVQKFEEHHPGMKFVVKKKEEEKRHAC